MSDYEKFVEELTSAGITYHTFTDEDKHTVVRFDEYEQGYTEHLYDEAGNCICCTDIFEGQSYIHTPSISDEQLYKQSYINYFAELQLMGNLL